MRRIEFDIAMTSGPEKTKGYLHVLTGDGSDKVFVGIHKKGSKWQATELNTGYKCFPRVCDTRQDLADALDKELVCRPGGRHRDPETYFDAIQGCVDRFKQNTPNLLINADLVYKLQHGERV